MQRFFLYANTGKPEALPSARRLIQLLAQRNAQVMVDAWLYEQLGMGIPSGIDELTGDTQAVVCFGGDGTLLRILPALAIKELPVLGVNTGHTGFLMETGPEGLFTQLDRLLAGDYQVSRRAMLSCSVNGVGETLVMNELALTRGNNPSSLVVDVAYNEELVYTIHGDGVLISTPTGTTGYCLSAGGPVLHPEVPCHVVVPVCSHIMHQRPVVLPDSGTITLRVRANHGTTHQINMDGQIVYHPEAGSEVIIRKSNHQAGFIRFESQRFLSRLHHKQLEWSNHVYGGKQ